MGKGGKISYKKLSPYMNNERCEELFCRILSIELDAKSLFHYD